MSDIEPPPTFGLQAFAFIWVGIVVAAGILFGILTGLPKILMAVILLIFASPGMWAYSVARRRRREHYQRLVNEAFSDIRTGPSR